MIGFQAKVLYQFIVQASYLTAQFGWAQCVPDVCSYNDTIFSASIMLDAAGPMAGVSSQLLTDENKRKELDSFGQAMV